jgi:gliding motility-associated-like protein
VDCSNGTTSIAACDDGNPCTSDDEQMVLDSDGSICVPCAGMVVDCSTGPITVMACNDGDANTANDEQTVLDCDGSVCIPCAGTPLDCANGTTSVVACDDGDPCTSSDEQTVLDANGGICTPCAGVVEDCSSGTTSTMACEDGNVSTINDEETILDCDGSICIPCAGTQVQCSTGMTSVVACDDGDSCTVGDQQTILDVDGSVCILCAGVLEDCSSSLTSVVACDDGDSFTVNDEQTVLDCDGSICIPCTGTPCRIEINIGGDRTILIGDSIELNITTNAVVDSVIWQERPSLSCTDCINPVAKPAMTTSYEVLLIDDQGCEVWDRITIIVDRNRKVFIPTAFSPNGDGINDVFSIQARNNSTRVLALRVYNRWGVEVFNRGDKAFGSTEHFWDGRFRGEDVAVGVYIYVADLEFLDGGKEIMTGEVMILR